MTGQEKIQVIVDEIAGAYDELVTGNVVSISSSLLESKGLSLNEQRQCLDILAKDKKIIKYKSVKDFTTENDIDGQLLYEIYEAASDNVELPFEVAKQNMIDDLLQSMTYKIEVLNGFKAFASSTPTPASDNTSQAKVKYDWRNALLIYGDKELEVADMSLMHFVCKLTFKNRHVAIDEDDILDAAAKGQDSKRAVYDAVLAINKKANDTFGVKKLLIFKAGKVRIDRIYQ